MEEPRELPDDEADQEQSTGDDAPAGEGLASRLGFAAAGAAFELGSRMSSMAAYGQRAAKTVEQHSQWFLDSPPVRPVRAFTTEQLDRLSDKGKEEIESTANSGIDTVRKQGARLGESSLFPEVLDDVAAPVIGPVMDSALPVVFERLANDPDALLPVVNAVVDAVLPEIMPQVMDRLADDPEMLVPVIQSLLGPILDAALPEVFAKLGEDPDELARLMTPMVDSLLGALLPIVVESLNGQQNSIRALIIEQSGGMASDMADAMRSRAINADDAFDRFLMKLHLRRRPRPAVETIVPPLGEITASTEPAEPPASTATAAVAVEEVRR